MEQFLKYQRANSEILEIINYLPVEEQKMIPQEKIDFYEKNKDKSHDFKYNPLKSLSEQNVLRETKALIVTLFRDIFATEEQKEKLKVILAKNEQKYQEELSQKYNEQDLFNKKSKNLERKVQEDIEDNALQMAVYKESVLHRILSFIKKVLKI